MDFGICVASKIDEVGLIAHMENLGYSHAWVADTQMMWSDCYAVLALAAGQTRSIKIGTGVAVAGTRIAPVTANSIATINPTTANSDTFTTKPIFTSHAIFIGLDARLSIADSRGGRTHV